MKKPVICLMGPTAVGKTAMALSLAQQIPCEVISVDSVMVYKGMDIGTAKPSLSDQCKVPHHLLSIQDPASPYSVAQFVSSLPKLIKAIHDRGRIPLLVGGTGLYFQAWEDGLAQMPAADPGVRTLIQQTAMLDGWGGLHARLALIDPRAAQRIHPSDRQRIQRALEVYILTEKPYTMHLEAQAQLVSTTKLMYGIERILILPEDKQQLGKEIQTRFNRILEQGFVEEVRALWSRGDLSDTLPAVRSVGYRQAWAYISDRCTYEDMVKQALVATRQYAKRQVTWFKRIQNTVVWTQPRKEQESSLWLKNKEAWFSLFVKWTNSEIS